MFILTKLTLFALLVLFTASFAQYPFNNKQKAIEYSRLDVDVKDAEVGFDDGDYLSVVAPIYNNGKYAKPRTLKKLSTTAGNVMAKEPTFELFKKYWGTPRYADRAIVQIIQKKGLYAKQTQKFRADAGIKIIQYHSIWMWVIHQMEVAVKQCRAQKKFAAITAWDYAVADYMGSQIVEDESNAGYLLHTLAVKRCSQFESCVTKGGVEQARINNRIYFNFRKGKESLQKGGQCGQVNARKNIIIRFMHVPLIQGCLRYIVKTKNDSGDDKSKSHGEGWAFCAAFLPTLNRCDKNAAKVIRNNLGPLIAKPMGGSINFVFNQIYKNLKCLGLKCSDVGKFVEVDGTPVCKDN